MSGRTAHLLFPKVSFLVLLGILGFWFATFLSVPLTTSLVPTIGIDVGPLVGNVLSNYAFVTTVPSWLGVKHPKVSVHTAVLLSLGVALGMYLSIGLIGEFKAFRWKICVVVSSNRFLV